eukprot:scaffold303244_cov21-Prasinocladus_malaysianus.AAC.1
MPSSFVCSLIHWRIRWSLLPSVHHPFALSLSCYLDAYAARPSPVVAGEESLRLTAAQLHAAC